MEESALIFSRSHITFVYVCDIFEAMIMQSNTILTMFGSLPQIIVRYDHRLTLVILGILKMRETLAVGTTDLHCSLGLVTMKALEMYHSTSAS